MLIQNVKIDNIFIPISQILSPPTVHPFSYPDFKILDKKR